MAATLVMVKTFCSVAPARTPRMLTAVSRKMQMIAENWAVDRLAALPKTRSVNMLLASPREGKKIPRYLEKAMATAAMKPLCTTQK